jgi:hypothetical protein
MAGASFLILVVGMYVGWYGGRRWQRRITGQASGNDAARQARAGRTRRRDP